jgi:hypothetical protein
MFERIHSIALLIKDNYDTRGVQITGGSLAMEGFATLVRRPVGRLKPLQAGSNSHTYRTHTIGATHLFTRSAVDTELEI